MRAYYPVQMGASFAQGAMDAYNRFVGMQADIKSRQRDHDRYMEALTFRNQQAEQSQQNWQATFDHKVDQAAQTRISRMGQERGRAEQQARGLYSDFVKSQGTYNDLSLQASQLQERIKTNSDKPWYDPTEDMFKLARLQNQMETVSQTSAVAGRGLGIGYRAPGEITPAQGAVFGSGQGPVTDTYASGQLGVPYQASGASQGDDLRQGVHRQGSVPYNAQGGTGAADTGEWTEVDHPNKPGEVAWFDGENYHDYKTGLPFRPIPKKPASMTPEAVQRATDVFKANEDKLIETVNILRKYGQRNTPGTEKVMNWLFGKDSSLANVPDDVAAAEILPLLTQLQESIKTSDKAFINDENFPETFKGLLQSALYGVVDSMEDMTDSEKNHFVSLISDFGGGNITEMAGTRMHDGSFQSMGKPGPQQREIEADIGRVMDQAGLKSPSGYYQTITGRIARGVVNKVLSATQALRDIPIVGGDPRIRAAHAGVSMAERATRPDARAVQKQINEGVEEQWRLSFIDRDGQRAEASAQKFDGLDILDEPFNPDNPDHEAKWKNHMRLRLSREVNRVLQDTGTRGSVDSGSYVDKGEEGVVFAYNEIQSGRTSMPAALGERRRSAQDLLNKEAIPFSLQRQIQAGSDAVDRQLAEDANPSERVRRGLLGRIR